MAQHYLMAQLLLFFAQSMQLQTTVIVAFGKAEGEKTVRRAIKGNGIIKGKWLIKSLGLANISS